jgi:hypothetical protein
MPPALDNLEMVERVMALEEFFVIEIPDREAEAFGNPREIVDTLEALLANSRPNQKAVEMFKRIAKKEDRPELLKDVNGLWRRDQIAAIIRAILGRTGD